MTGGLNSASFSKARNIIFHDVIFMASGIGPRGYGVQPEWGFGVTLRRLDAGRSFYVLEHDQQIMRQNKDIKTTSDSS